MIVYKQGYEVCEFWKNLIQRDLYLEQGMVQVDMHDVGGGGLCCVVLCCIMLCCESFLYQVSRQSASLVSWVQQ